MKTLKLLLASAVSGLFLSTSAVNAELMQLSTPFGFDARSAGGDFLSDFPANSFKFSLGAFDTGFTPSSDNFSDWISNWTEVVETPWRVAGPAAAKDRVNVTFNQSIDALAGTQGYVWGYDQTTDLSSAQWILVTNPNWIFPAWNELSVEIKPENSWSIGPEAIAIFGSISDTGMQFQAVPEPSTYALIFGLGILGFLGYRRVRK